MTEEPMFWIVWCPTGSQPPKSRHSEYERAVLEAERLARCVPGHKFYVCGIETMRVVDDMKRVDYVRPAPF